MKNFLSFLFEAIKIVVVALVIVIPIRYFLFQPFLVEGSSMRPNFHDNDYLIVNEISYRLRDPQRGEVVVFYYPQDHSKRFIKRIIGLPGETIQAKEGNIFIINSEGESMLLDETSYLPQTDIEQDFEKEIGLDEYFVMGDNRRFSFDSRNWGNLPRKDIIGCVLFKAFPLADFSFATLPVYNN